MEWRQDLDAGVPRRFQRQAVRMSKRKMKSGASPGCLSMVQSCGQNRPVSRVDGVIKGLWCREEKPGLA